MKRKLAVLGIAALVAAAAAGCGHDNSDSGMTPPPAAPPPPAPTTLNLAPSAILSDYALKPSETSSPVSVNDGAVTIAETSDSTAPLSVNAN